MSEWLIVLCVMWTKIDTGVWVAHNEMGLFSKIYSESFISLVYILS